MVKALTFLVALVAGVSISYAGPIHEAAMNGDVKKVEELLSQDPKLIDAHDADDHGCTPLQDAACFQKIDVMKVLIAHKADVEAKNDDGRTAIYWAAGGKDDAVKVAELLINSGAKADVVDKLNTTPLHDAAQVGNKELVKLLIDKGAKVDAKDNYGWTPLYLAAMYNDKTDVVLLLLSLKAEINSHSTIGWTPLDAAMGMNKDANAELLRKNGGKSGK